MWCGAGGREAGQAEAEAAAARRWEEVETAKVPEVDAAKAREVGTKGERGRESTPEADEDAL